MNKISDSTYFLQISGDATSAELHLAWEIPEPFVELGRTTSDETTLVLLDKNGAVLYELPAPDIRYDPEWLTLGDHQYAGPVYFVNLKIPKDDRIRAAMLRVLVPDSSSRLDVTIAGIDQIDTLVEGNHPVDRTSST